MLSPPQQLELDDPHQQHVIPTAFNDREIRDYFDSCADPNWKILITGPNGTGKTTFMSRLVLASGRRFDEVFVLCNTHTQTAYDNLSFKYNRFTVVNNKLGFGATSASGNPDEGAMLINELANTKPGEPKFSVLFIVDDVPKPVFCNAQFESFVRNARHNSISIIFITHALGLVSAGVRPEFDIFMLSPSGKYTMDIVNKTNAQAADVCRQLASSIQMGLTSHLNAQCYLVSIFRREVEPSRAFYVPHQSEDERKRSAQTRMLPMILTKASYYFHTLMYDESAEQPPGQQQQQSAAAGIPLLKPHKGKGGHSKRKRKAATVVIPISALIPPPPPLPPPIV